MRTLVESILDGDLDAHDEAVFMDQIIPEIRDHTHPMLRSLLKDMTIKVENGNRILDFDGKNSFLTITDEIVQVLEKYNVHEVRSKGTIEIAASLTKFDISAPNIPIEVHSEDLHFMKCDITCDTLLINGDNNPTVKCNQCQIKTQSYKISRTPIEFNNSKIIGLDSVQLSFNVLPTRRTLEDLGVLYTVRSGFTPDASFDEKVPHFDPLKELAGIEKIAKLPNIYLYSCKKAFEDHMAGLVFKSPRIPIDKQVKKVIIRRGGAAEPIDCANGYEAIFTNIK